MLRKLSLLFSVLVLAFAVAACGDDEEDPASGGTETTQTEDSGTTEETTTEEDSGSEEDTGSTDVSDNPQVQAAVQSCKDTVNAQAQLSDELKADLEGVCEKAGSGDIEDAQEASVEVCVKIAEEMVPEGSARDQVIEQCEAAAP